MEAYLLTDVALKNLRPKDKGYKVTDRDGMYERQIEVGAAA